MEIKTINSQLVYFKEFETTLADLGQFVGDTPEQMIKEVEQAGGAVAGPLVWQYDGADGKPDTRFKLTIGVPVAASIDALSANVKTLPEFKSAVVTHEGPWENLGKTYEAVMGEISKSGNTPGTVCREIYHVVDFKNPQNHVTEVQVQLN